MRCRALLPLMLTLFSEQPESASRASVAALGYCQLNRQAPSGVSNGRESYWVEHGLALQAPSQQLIYLRSSNFVCACCPKVGGLRY